MLQEEKSGQANVPKQLKRLGITGTHGAGKSTLTDLLAKELGLTPLCGLKTMQSAPTTVAQEMGYARSSQVPKEERELFQWMCLFRQREFENNAKEFVSGRTSLEYFAYWTLELGRGSSTYEAACRFMARSYDAILYLPMNSKPPEDNGQRYLVGTKEVDEFIREALWWPEVADKVIRVEANTPEDRVRETLSDLFVRDFTWEEA